MYRRNPEPHWSMNPSYQIIRRKLKPDWLSSFSLLMKCTNNVLDWQIATFYRVLVNAEIFIVIGSYEQQQQQK